MSIGLHNYWLLLLLIPAIGVTFGIYYLYMKRNARQRFFLILRTLVVVLLILAIADPVLTRYGDETATIFVADLSSSTKIDQEAMEAFISEAIDGKGEKDNIGIISFGHDSQIEKTVADYIEFDGFETNINSNFTDIQQAMIQGTAMFPAGMKKRLVVLTDGRENVGDVSRQISATIQNNIAVDFYNVDTTEVAEAQVEAVELPKQGEKNQIIEIKVQIDSNVNQEATLYLYSKNELKKESEVTLDVGENYFTFDDVISEDGTVSYTAEIVPKQDTYIENNRASAFIMVEDMPSIMVIEDDEEQGTNIIAMLDGYGKVTVKKAKEVPETLSSLLDYDAFIMVDVSITDLSETFLENLENMVSEQGKGLLVIGGDNSYGLGGYDNTILEEMLPVEMEVKSKEEKPNLGLLLVIDKSGSMSSGQYGVTKLELAKEAAIRAVDILDDKDQLGVLGFDDAYKWVVELSQVSDKQVMEDQIATLVPGGGTSILPALSKAIATLEDADVGLKHIILMTDGQAEREGYAPMIEQMADIGITLSTVAVGGDADKQLMYYLAESSGGRYYATDVFTDIPSIFMKEAYMAGKKYLNNISFYPEVYSSSPVLSGLEGLPQLDGYVAVSKRDNARTVLVGPEDDPILAHWQYGLGRTMAWTSDMKGLWSSKWLGWDGNRHFWINAVSWLVQEGINNTYDIDSSYDNGVGKITVTSSQASSTMIEEMTGTLIDPEGNVREIEIEATAPGEYEGDFIPSREGVYLVSIPMDDGTLLASGVNVGYSPEYDILGNEMTAPESLARLSGGRVIEKPSEVFTGKVPPVKGSYDLKQWLLVLALLLFMLEVITRKSRWTFDALEKIRAVLSKVTTKKEAKSVAKADDVELASEEELTDEASTIKRSKKKNVKKSKKVAAKPKVDTEHIDALMKQKAKREKQSPKI